jgi:hypothetical protein
MMQVVNELSHSSSDAVAKPWQAGERGQARRYRRCVCSRYFSSLICFADAREHGRSVFLCSLPFFWERRYLAAERECMEGNSELVRLPSFHVACTRAVLGSADICSLLAKS